MDREHAMSDDAPRTRSAGLRPRICFVVSSPMTAEAFLTENIRALSERYQVDLVLNADPGSIQHPDLRRARIHRARIVREISPLADLKALIELLRILKRGQYSAVHSLTPKAGLLTALAGFIARVPIRVHTYTGQVWATRRSAGRWGLKQLDRLIARLNTHLLVDSRSQREFLRAEGVLRPSQGDLIGNGSVCGVDPQRFKPGATPRARIRAELEIPQSALVFLFVGRLNRDKGVFELASAFDEVAGTREDLHLVLVGPDEDALAPQVERLCAASASRLRFVGWTDEPECYMAASDVFCLPSHREGFGSVIIEAAAAGLPSIGSRIYGIVDAIDEGETGLLFEAGNVPQLVSAMRRMADDDGLRKDLAGAARTRALRDFSRESLTAAFLSFYERALEPIKREREQERLRSDFD